MNSTSSNNDADRFLSSQKSLRFFDGWDRSKKVRQRALAIAQGSPSTKDGKRLSPILNFVVKDSLCEGESGGHGIESLHLMC